MANAVSATIWKSSSQVLLNLENENFQTTTQSQRIDVVEEIASYLIHLADRWVYREAGEDSRVRFVSALARDMARMLEDSRCDVQGVGEYQQAFIERLNRRSSDYAEYRFDIEEGASFRLRSTFGQHIAEAMGERDNKWIPDYIIGRESPIAESALFRSLKGLVKFDEESGSAGTQ